MDIRNPQYNAAGSIDCEINHPVFGWIPFTATPHPSEPLGTEIFQDATLGKLGPIAPYVTPPIPVPASISRFQARAMLLQTNLLAGVEAMMAAPETDAFARLAWADASIFRRNSPLVTAMAGTLGLSEGQLDDMFRFANTIEA
jgi:hypothetical protein